MRKSEQGRERGRASESWSCEREIICYFTLCLKNKGRRSVVETEKWEKGDGDWEAYVETENHRLQTEVAMRVWDRGEC